MTSLRFVLDQDVDHECVRVLTAMGHQAWTVGAAGRATATDVDQLIYASELGAILVTHDKEFAQSRSRQPIGRLIRLRCAEWDAPELLEVLVQDCEELLARNRDLLVVASFSPQRRLQTNLRFGTERDGL